jgi:hypothetical protein
VSHTPLTALAVMAGIGQCSSVRYGHNGSGSSNLGFDKDTVLKLWEYARKEGMIPENDPKPFSTVKKNTPNKTINAPLELPAIPQEEINQTPITIIEVLNIFKKYLCVEEDESITIPLAETISNFAPIEPDIVGIIGASGSAKTEFIRALGETENQYIYPVSSITGHTLVSGFEHNVDLAPSLRNRLMTIKDFTTLLAKRADEVSEIFADLRELTDGHIGKDGDGKLRLLVFLY